VVSGSATVSQNWPFIGRRDRREWKGRNATALGGCVDAVGGEQKGRRDRAALAVPQATWHSTRGPARRARAVAGLRSDAWRS
jgi:hypothetical protein